MIPILESSQILFGSIWANRLWYSLPLVVVISLVYSATRHELMVPILQHAWRFGLWILAFMLIVFVILALLSAWL
jgi:hypothetical protein